MPFIGIFVYIIKKINVFIGLWDLQSHLSQEDHYDLIVYFEEKGFVYNVRSSEFHPLLHHN